MRPLIVNDSIVTVPVLPEVQRVIEQWTATHSRDLERRLVPYRVTPRDIAAPTYERVVWSE